MEKKKLCSILISHLKYECPLFNFIYKFAKDDSGALGTSNLPINTQVGFSVYFKCYKYSTRLGPWIFCKTSILCVRATRLGGFTANN